MLACGIFLLQIRDYKRSGKAGSATIKGREEMKGAPNRLNSHVISSDKRESMNSFPCKNDLLLLLLRRENHRGTISLVI